MFSKKHLLRLFSLDSLALFLSCLAICGSVVYYFYALNGLGIFITTLFTFIAYFFSSNYLKSSSLPQLKSQVEKEEPTKNINPSIKLLLLLIYTALYLGLVITLIKFSSDRALVSPWEVIPNYFWLLFFALSFCLIIALVKLNLSKRNQIILLSFHSFLCFSVALIVYKINYGFDPFIHQATMELIAKTGSVAPKPFYYLGEYSIIIWFNKIFGLSIYWLNRLIVPFLAALLIPGALFKWLKHSNENQGINSSSSYILSILALLILPFSIFVMNTPQNLSYLFLILTIFTALNYSKKLLIPSIFALATFCIHPLTGLAAIGLLAFLFLDKHKKYFSKNHFKILKSLILSGLVLVWPLAFYLSTASSFSFSSFKIFISQFVIPLSFFPNQEKLWLNFSYILSFNYPIFIALLIALAIYYYRYKLGLKNLNALVLTSGAVFLAWIISSLLSFSALINYEQNNYPERLLIIIIILNLPIILKLFSHAFDLILIRPKLDRLIWLFIMSGWLCASFYLSYPRLDNYFNSRGYSVSRADVEAVKLIAKNSPRDYVVLANQQTSAAALKELGFNHYYQTAKGQIYFYPIPTGGDLYQLYLDMVYKKPQRSAMVSAMNLVRVNRSYFVINKYWKDSKKIIENAKLEANNFYVIRQGEIYIFEYDR